MEYSTQTPFGRLGFCRARATVDYPAPIKVAGGLLDSFAIIGLVVDIFLGYSNTMSINRLSLCYKFELVYLLTGMRGSATVGHDEWHSDNR